FAKKYIWWKTPEVAVSNPYRVLTGAMNLGSYEDYKRLINCFDKAILLKTLNKSAPGWFSSHSWSFWHRVLDSVDISESVPPLPEKNLNEKLL
ncbi:MAG: hypothetical protein KAH21_02900, partial [Spirochaetaceae bacterium]|nr:hypothetical protein [Spirochaetaceae bacterium]